MTLLDSSPTSKSLFDAGLAQAVQTNQGLTTDDTPSEHWPYAKGTVPGGDQPLHRQAPQHQLHDERPRHAGRKLAARGHIAHLFGMDGLPSGRGLEHPDCSHSECPGGVRGPDDGVGDSGRGRRHAGEHVGPDDQQPRDLHRQHNGRGGVQQLPDDARVPRCSDQHARAPTRRRSWRSSSDIVLGPSGQKIIRASALLPPLRPWSPLASRWPHS